MRLITEITGKRIGGSLYLHYSTLDTLSKHDQERVLEASEMLPEGFHWEILMLDKDFVAFIQCDEWDYIYEPIVGDRYKVFNDGRVVFKRGGVQIYHRRHLFVKPDYKGFDVQDDIKRVEWWSQYKPDTRRMGYLNWWLRFLEEIGGTRETY